MPVLANVLLSAPDNRLAITGTDLEVELVAATKVGLSCAVVGRGRPGTSTCTTGRHSGAQPVVAGNSRVVRARWDMSSENDGPSWLFPSKPFFLRLDL